MAEAFANRANLSINVDGNVVHYIFGSRLGSGSFGNVKACDVARPAVIKEVPLKQGILADVEQDRLRKCAIDEGKLLSMLCHPNVLRTYYSWVDDNGEAVYLELEYCGGKSLKHYIVEQKGKQIEIDTLRNWYAQIALGLNYIHIMGVLHRDIKSENVLLTTDRQVLKIADFGIAKKIGTLADSTNNAGTMTYMAPELFLSDDSEVRDNPKTDIWSYGVMAYELAELTLPFPLPPRCPNAAVHMARLFDRGTVPSGYGTIEKKYSRELRNFIEKKILVIDHNARADMDQVFADPFVAEEIGRLQEQPEYKCYSDSVQQRLKKYAKLKKDGAQQQSGADDEELNRLKAEYERQLAEERQQNQTLKEQLAAATQNAIAERQEAKRLEKQLSDERQTVAKLQKELNAANQKQGKVEKELQLERRKTVQQMEKQIIPARDSTIDQQKEFLQGCYDGNYDKVYAVVKSAAENNQLQHLIQTRFRQQVHGDMPIYIEQNVLQSLQYTPSIQDNLQ